MHELSVITSILEIVIEHANKNGANRVSQINLQVGELSDLVPDYMQNYFEFAGKGTIAESAKLVIDRVPAVIRCRICAHQYALDRETLQFLCPACGSTDVEILSGREFRVMSIEVD